MITIIILAFSAFLITLVGIRLSIPMLRLRTAPSVRQLMKKAPAPALNNGGIAVVFALVIGLLGTEIDYIIVLSIFLLAGASLLANIIKLPTFFPLLIQMIAVALPLLTIHQPIFSADLPFITDHILAGLTWIIIIRLFAAMNKAQGVVASPTIAIGLGLSVIMVVHDVFLNDLSNYSIIFAGVGFGVLWWNWPPAKILLGTIGNWPLGYVAGYLLLLATLSGYGLSALILLAYIAAEGSVMWAQKSKTPLCVSLSEATDKDTAARYVAGIHMLLVLLAVLSSLDATMAWFHACAAYAMSFGVLWIFMHKSKRNDV